MVDEGLWKKKFPSPFEWVSMILATIALVVSGLTYKTTRDTEAALQENISIECRPVAIKIFPVDMAKYDAKLNGTPQLEGQWVAHVYNNSRTPVTIAGFDHDISTPNGYESSGMVGATQEKNGADHYSGDEDVRLAAQQATTVAFVEFMPISIKAAATPGIETAKSIKAANRILLPLKIDIFGRELVNNNGESFSYKYDPKIFTWVNMHVKTSTGKIFSAKCYPVDAWWE
jgi:hypothetical protein